MIKNWKLTLVLIASSFCFSTAYSQSLGDAKKAEEQENYDEAIRTYRKLLAGNTDDNIYFSLGNAYLQNEKVDSANYYFNQGLARNKKSAINMVGLGKAKLMQKDLAGAEQHFNDALKRSRSKDPRVLNEIGRAYLEANQNLDQAVGHLQASLKRDNKNPETYLILGDIYLEQNKGGDAMNNYEQALRLNPNMAKVQVKRGNLFVRSRNATQAEAAYKAAIQADPNYAPTYRELGDLYLLMGKYDEAANMYQKNMDLAGSSAQMQYKYATALYSGKKFDEAHQQIQKALTEDPNNIGMQRLQAYTHYEAGENEKALELMEAYMQKTDPSKYILDDYRYYGQMLAKAGRNEEAVNMLNKAIEMDPENAAGLHEVLALIHYGQKDYGKAAEQFQLKIQKAEPTLADYYRLADSYYWNKDYQKSDSLFAIITEQQPQYAPAHFARGRSNYFIDSSDGNEEGLAVPHYQKFIELTPVTNVGQLDPSKKEQLVEAHSYLAAYYTDKKDNQKATEHWQAVMAVDPANEQANQALNKGAKPAGRKPAARR
jgi:tetratricopeptide (TPR) repeat protein